MRSFDYHRPASLADVSAALKAAPEARLLAGGMTLIPALKLRLATPSALVDLSAIAELRGIRGSAGAITVGAMTRHAELERSPQVREAIPALAELAGMIGDPQVRNRGTLGGSIANNDPSADYPAAVLGLGASIITNQRSIAADDFFTGIFETALRPGEIITAVSFPVRVLRVRKVSQPGIALCAGRRVRREDAERCARGCHRRGALRFPRYCDGDGARGEICADVAREHSHAARWAQLRHACRRPVSSPPHRCARAQSGGKDRERRVEALMTQAPMNRRAVQSSRELARLSASEADRRLMPPGCSRHRCHRGRDRGAGKDRRRLQRHGDPMFDSARARRARRPRRGAMAVRTQSSRVCRSP
jgi:hypothetical protein